MVLTNIRDIEVIWGVEFEVSDYRDIEISWGVSIVESLRLFKVWCLVLAINLLRLFEVWRLVLVINWVIKVSCGVMFGVEWRGVSFDTIC